MFIVLVGPIDYWWNENWETPEHLNYKNWRDHVNRLLVEAGHLVYRPHEAMKGAWVEKAQKINDTAILMADCLVNLCPPGVPAYGTKAECELAYQHGIPVIPAPPCDLTHATHLIKPLDDPYGDVHRKSYTKND